MTGFAESRLPGRLEATGFAERMEAARGAAERAGRETIDLLVSNPTVAFRGLREAYGPTLGEAAKGALEEPYAPTERGQRAAREAVAGYYAERGVDIDAERIVVTASTSEAYGWLAKLLCEPGEAIAHPTPSYPLFEHLLRLESVQARPYRLEYRGRWAVDVGDLRSTLAQAEAPVRGIICVNPNNPTGQRLSGREFEALVETVGDRALIVDEVFADYPVDADAIPSVLERTAALPSARRPLTFALSGFSKVAGQPGLKFGWIAVDGPDARVDRALERLEFIRDAYLSASTVTQRAAPRVLERRHSFQQRVRVRLQTNRKTVRNLVAERPAWEAYPVEGGWYQVLRYPAVVEEAEFAVELLEEAGVAVHPGFFYDLRRGHHLVVSLLTPEEDFRRGLEAMFGHWEDTQN